MSRYPSNRCVNCGFGFLFGPVFTDFMTIIKKHGFRRTYDFDYRLYTQMFGQEYDPPWPTEVSFDDCDSVFLGCLVDSKMKCPKCGQFAFAEESS
jgi:hypothetical protein